MEKIGFDTLCKILQDGLSEEVKFSGHLWLFTGKHSTDNLFWSHKGNVSLEPRWILHNEERYCSVNSNLMYTLTYGNNHKLHLTQREEISYYGHAFSPNPSICIPLSIGPEAHLVIDKPTNIKY